MSTPVPYSGIKAVIMANRPTFASETEGYTTLFGLLPVANKPILAHLIDYIKSFGISDVTLVCLNRDRSGYASFLDSCGMDIQLCGVNVDVTTCDIIKIVAEGKHVMIYPIDLFTTVDLTGIFDFHVSHNAQMTVVAGGNGMTANEIELAPGPLRQFRSLGKRYLVYDSASPERLVTLLSDEAAIGKDVDLTLKQDLQNSEEEDFAGEDDVRDSVTGMDIAPIHLNGYRSLVVDNVNELSGLYLLSPKCISFIRMNDCHSIESELIPRMCIEAERGEEPAVFIYYGQGELAMKVIDYESLYTANMKCSTKKLGKFLPGAEFKPMQGESGYFVEDAETISGNFQMTPFCVYGSSITVADNASIRRAIIGRNCKIGAGCKIQNSVICGRVTIEDNVTLQNCLIGDESVIKAGSNLQKCVVCPRYCGDAALKKDTKTVIQSRT